MLDEVGNLQRFSFVADIPQVFGFGYKASTGLTGVIQGRDARCSIPSNAFPSDSQVHFSLSFDTEQYYNDCFDILNPIGLFFSGPGPTLTTNKNSYFSFDVRSYIVAAAINSGIFNDFNCAGRIENCLEEVIPKYR